MQAKNERWLPWLLGIGALLPRLCALSRYVTPDELIWVYRSVLFREALRQGAWVETLVSGHPGVITTWLGSIGISLQLWLHPPSRALYTWLTQLAWWMPDNMAAFANLAQFLMVARLLVALVHSTGLVIAYYLVRRLWGHRAALLFALLLALDPFVAGLSGLLHVDGLMTTFALLSLLALSVWLGAASEGEKRPFFLFFSAVCAALALLTKSPAVLLLPLTALFLGVRWLLAVWQSRQPAWAALRRLVGAGLIWLAVLAGVTLLLFPALWAGPQDVWTLLSGNANRHIEEALRPTFFLGRVTYDHGPLFYPMVLAFRLGPVAFAGLLLGGVMVAKRPFSSTNHSLSVWLLLAWSVLFVIGISFAAKKFDRYMLPVIPTLTLPAVLAWDRLRLRTPAQRRIWWAGLLGVQVVYLLSVLPYPLSAYNPLLGGTRVVQRVLPVGWGEGISRAGSWLDANIDGAEQRTAVSGIAPALAPFFSGETLLRSDEGVARADYVVITLADRQTEPERVAAWTEGLPLLHTMRYGGVSQVWIYRQPDPAPPLPPVDAWAEPLAFGEQVQLWGASATASATTVNVGLRWGLSGPTPDRFKVQLTLRDEAGRVWRRMETELLNDVYFYPQHWADGERPLLRYELSLPPGIPPVTYTVDVALFAAAAGAQLPLLDANGRFQGTVYATETVAIPPAPDLLDAADLDVPVRREEAVSAGLLLLGHEPLPPSALAGTRVQVNLYWQAAQTLPPGETVTFAWAGNEQVVSTTLPLSRYDSARWRIGEVVQEKYTLPLPSDLAAGAYELRLEDLTLGQVEVVATDRLFVLPPDVPLPLQYRFGDAIILRGAAPPQPAAPGMQTALTLYWQVETVPPDLITAFVHVVGEGGRNVAQSDQWPGGLPSNTWAAGQVIVDKVLLDVPPDLPPGEYPLAVGLYTAANGLRLPAFDGAGTAVVDDRVLLPVPLVVEE